MNKAMFVLAISQAGSLALAQTGEAPVSLEPHKVGATSYVCGGISLDEQQAIKGQAGKYDLMLTFAVSNGAYLADVDVEIRNAKGVVVLNAKCEGPIMLVDLPGGGTWRVTAQANGQTRQKTITAGSGRVTRATFIWPAGAS